ncbi:MAG: bifunctional 4-hydroxy-3-methylbut-2-enyl diphosphate reductase/30S ribosomal protein S1 [Clostridia bacterium]|nr:bifunctional 4-hydroxy-3-methylbut-2-enyl diphosphate reductase/30S ribosomal protein S1 [Clostridia bacterium]
MGSARIRLADVAGFCRGVARACEIACRAGEEAIHSGGCGAVTLGPLVHNPDVSARLRASGVQQVRSMDDVSGRVFIIPSHGLPPEVIESARERGLTIVDATCPHVHRAQREVEKAHASGKFVVLVGDRSHPEVRAVAAFAAGDIAVVAGSDEAGSIPLPMASIVVVAQTTQRRSMVDAVACILTSRGAEVAVVDTVCPATGERQDAAARLSSEVDLMVVIGGEASANTMRLAEVCRDSGAAVLKVENASELDTEVIRASRSIGVTAGASTPSWVIEEVMDAMNEIIEGNPEQVQVQVQDLARDAEKPAEPIQPEQEKAQVQSQAHGASVEAEILQGRVTELYDDRVIVELDPGQTVVVLKEQLTAKPIAHPSEVVAVGDEVHVVLDRQRPGSDEQYASKRRADVLLMWKRLENAKETGEVIEGKVTESVKGGLVVDIGVRGFVPASQVGRRFVEDLSSYVGQTLRLAVREVERLRSNVVLSHRAVLEEEERAAKERAFDVLSRGQVLAGTVTRLASFGAFVDIGDGVEGLLHISDIAWSRIKHPSEVLSEGQQIQVQIQNVDRERERISLGYKQLQSDPWEDASRKFAVGSVVRGTVTKLVDFGAFVSLADGIEGLVHISQLADRRVAKPDEIVSVGQEVSVKVIGLREQEHRISLSMKQAAEDGERSDYRKYMKENKADDVVTIGDRINWDPSKLKGPANGDNPS